MRQEKAGSLCKVKSYEVSYLTNPLEYGLVGSILWLLSQVTKWEKLREHGKVFRPATGFGELQVNWMKECSIYWSWQVLMPCCSELADLYLNEYSFVGSFPGDWTPIGP